MHEEMSSDNKEDQQLLPIPSIALAGTLYGLTAQEKSALHLSPSLIRQLYPSVLTATLRLCSQRLERSNIIAVSAKAPR
jgi:hypothetical protein